MASVLSQTLKDVLQYSKSAFGLFVLTAFIFSSFLFVSQNAQAQLVCRQAFVEQITNDPVEDSDQPSISADGSLIAFQSEVDLTGQNPDNRFQLFLYNTVEKEFTQVTFLTTGVASVPNISADGSLVTFHSQGDINGVPPNGEIQIYLYNVVTGIITPVTNETTGDSREPSINALGTKIAFRSDADINGGNPDNNSEIYQYDINTTVIKQITDTMTDTSSSASMNSDGELIAFRSSADLTGQNPSGFRQIFLYNGNTDSISQITKATTTTTSSTRYAIDGSGSLIAFSSDGNPNGGALPGNQTQVFLFDGSTFSFEQITSSPDQGAFSAAAGQDGSCVVFASRIDITGENPEEEVKSFLYDIPSATFEQVGNPPGRQSNPVASADCTKITFQSRINSVEQVFVATCIDPNAPSTVPTLSEWGLLAMAGALGIVGFMVMRRKKVTV